ncbi:CoA transferase [Acidothermaceae bacterium B102]|nr:CoA transferase [Acidothermaceae bacterium B102]
MTDDAGHAAFERALRQAIEQVTFDRVDVLPTVVGRRGWLRSRLAVEDAAAITVGVALASAARLQAFTTGKAAPTVTIDRDHLATAFRSEAYTRVDGDPLGAGFAPLSRFWPTADGWVRTHANYEWHRQALLSSLEIADAAGDPETVGAVLAGLTSQHVEDRVTAAGGIAAAVRTEQQWSRSEQGRAAAERLIVRGTTIGYAAPRTARTVGRPAEGLRVLDLTRVIAGPVGTRYLAALGADVLRLDPPPLPELPGQVPDGLLGKRSALLDASTDRGLDTLHELLDGADVVVHGYRPGALDRFGLDHASLAERHPGLVCVVLSAWGEDGPWGRRRGFDSIVQAASGIATVEASDGRPGALPCQLLDHGTGYLVAAAVLDAVYRQRTTGGTQHRSLALATTASWLLRLPRPDELPSPGEPSPRTATIGRLTAVTPPGSLDGGALTWPSGLPEYGADAPAW